MSSLEPLLRPVTAMINRQIQAKTPAHELCKKLSDRVMAVRVKDTTLAVYLVVSDELIDLSSDHIDDPDVVVSGSLISLAKLSGPSGEAAIRHGEIDISGDALVAQDFQKLLAYGKPDVEEELSTVIGDAAAHGLGELFRGFSAWRQNAHKTVSQNVSEYLQEESQAVPTRDEVDGFRRQVGTLRDDVARLDARMRKILAQHEADKVI